jgi:hypothetical protein
MTRKERNAERRADFQRRCLEYRIRCARRALPLAQLPEFVYAIEYLEGFRDGYVTRKRLAKIYRDLNARRKWKEVRYGYTPIGEIYKGVLRILSCTLHPYHGISSSDCQPFVEARFLAAEIVSPNTCFQDWGWAFKAMHAEYRYQEKQFSELFSVDLKELKGEKEAR